VEPGTVYWGHVSAVDEDYARTFAGNWTGTGTISGAGNLEVVILAAGEYMESEIWELGVGDDATIVRDKYRTGSETIDIKYKTSPTIAGIGGLGWTTYSTPVSSQRYFQVRIEN
jgi:hypothetical protein